MDSQDGSEFDMYFGMAGMPQRSIYQPDPLWQQYIFGDVQQVPTLPYVAQLNAVAQNPFAGDAFQSRASVPSSDLITFRSPAPGSDNHRHPTPHGRNTMPDVSAAAPTQSESSSNHERSASVSSSQPQSPAFAQQASVAAQRLSGPPVLVANSPLTATLSSPQDDAGPFPSGGGPNQRNYTIPPRPKPGRKPAMDQPTSKRKAQNRQSQRNFRIRKAAKMDELADKVKEANETRDRELGAKDSEIQRLQEQVHDLSQKLAYYQRRYSNDPGPDVQGTFNPYAEQYPDQGFMPHPNYALDTHGNNSKREVFSATPDTVDLPCARCNMPEHCACLAEIVNSTNLQSSHLDYRPLSPHSIPVSPMTGMQLSSSIQLDSANAFADLETDFTTKPSIAMTRDRDCGFCADNPESCICDPSVRPESDEFMDDVKQSPVVSGPGSCADCQANPQQQAWCRRVAQLRNEATPSDSRRTSSRLSFLRVMEPKVDSCIDLNRACASSVVGERSIGCSEAFKLLDGRVPIDADSMDWRNLKPVPTTVPNGNNTFTMKPGQYSAMEIDASSILTTLQHSRRPLEVRPSDGEFGNLIRDAAQQRQATMAESDDEAP